MPDAARELWPESEPQEDPATSSRVAVAVALAAKAGKMVKFLKAAKFAKVAVTLVTMLASVVVYAFALASWWVSVGLVLMLLIHELGHVWAAKREGLPTSLPVFIPMLGALILLKEPPESRRQEAYVGYGGPLVGSLAAAATFAAALLFFHGATQVSVMVISYIGAYLNLFNMIPIRPLDGGRVTQVIGEWFKYAGFVLLAVLVVAMQARTLVVIFILCLIEMRMPSKLKLAAGVSIELALVAMVVFGVGQDPGLAVDIFDLTLATLFNLSFVFEGEVVPEQPRAEPMRVRLRWLALYVALAVGLVALLLAHLPFLENING